MPACSWSPLLSGLTGRGRHHPVAGAQRQGRAWRRNWRCRASTLAVFSNSLVKAGLIALIGGRELALRTLPVMGLGLLLGLTALLLV